MKARLNPYAVAPTAMKPMMDFDEAMKESGLEPSLVELIKIRASQMNGCAYCLHMHTRDARKMGESEERIFVLDAWRESPLYSTRERAALAWTEAITRLPETHAPDNVYTALADEFTKEEQVKLTLLIGLINAWNRLAVGFRYVHST